MILLILLIILFNEMTNNDNVCNNVYMRNINDVVMKILILILILMY